MSDFLCIPDVLYVWYIGVCPARTPVRTVDKDQTILPANQQLPGGDATQADLESPAHFTEAGTNLLNKGRDGLHSGPRQNGNNITRT